MANPGSATESHNHGICRRKAAACRHWYIHPSPRTPQCPANDAPSVHHIGAIAAADPGDVHTHPRACPTHTLQDPKVSGASPKDPKTRVGRGSAAGHLEKTTIVWIGVWQPGKHL